MSTQTGRWAPVTTRLDRSAGGRRIHARISAARQAGRERRAVAAEQLAERREEASLRLGAVRRAATGRDDLSFWDVQPEHALRLAYNVVLRREPDAAGTADFLPLVESGAFTRDDLVEALYGSDEAHRLPRFRALGPSLHASRCEFIHTFPRASRIIDLGGTHQNSTDGALVGMGYPYDFDELVIVDLPPDDRHPIYRDQEKPDRVETRHGPVTYRYHSMADLSDYADGSFDLVYSGQTIEHVTEDDADRVLAESFRVLRPGGWMAIDTPNGRATRLQQDEHIDPDHEIEYRLDHLLEKVRAAGFVVTEVKGLNHLGRCLDGGEFDLEEVALHQGVFAAAEECYLLAVIAQRPDPRDVTPN